MSIVQGQSLRAFSKWYLSLQFIAPASPFEQCNFVQFRGHWPWCKIFVKFDGVLLSSYSSGIFEVLSILAIFGRKGISSNKWEQLRRTYRLMYQHVPCKGNPHYSMKTPIFLLKSKLLCIHCVGYQTTLSVQITLTASGVILG